MIRRNLRFLSVVLLLLLLLLGAGCEVLTDTAPTAIPSSALPDGEIATVTRVIDGDTIDVRLNGVEYRVRYVGVNTPERDEPCYAQASAANAALVQGRQVTLVRDVSDTDRYDRLLRYVYVDTLFVNAELVAEGWAEAGYYPPDTAYTAYFDRLEAEARSANRGCHPTGVFR